MNKLTIQSSAETDEALADSASLDRCYGRIRDILDSARGTVARSVNTAQVVSNWLIGKEIVEEEQRGLKRAAYGRQILLGLSARMVAAYGRGYSLPNLKHFRRLYVTYPDLMPPSRIGYTVCSQLQERAETPLGEASDVDSQARPGVLNPNLSWSHYRTLLGVSTPQARTFYEIETAKHCWPVRELQRHINTLLFERLAKSSNAEALLQAAIEGTDTQEPIDALNDPFVMDFMGLTSSSRLGEAEMEQRIVENMGAFLKAIGPGYTFVGRQQRITVNGDHFYIDLLLFNIRLNCHVVVELKSGKFEPRDLGQLQFYVNYFHVERRQADEGPTLGILLCADKNEVVARYAIGDQNKRLFANTYVTELPTEKQVEERIAAQLRPLAGLR